MFSNPENSRDTLERMASLVIFMAGLDVDIVQSSSKFIQIDGKQGVEFSYYNDSCYEGVTSETCIQIF